MPLDNLFSKGRIGNLETENRIVSSGTLNLMVKDGYLPDDYTKLYTDIAAGGTSLIITGTVFVGLILENRVVAKDLKSVINKIHEISNAKILIQLNILDMTPGENRTLKKLEITSEEIEKIINNFAKAAEIVYEIEADGIQVHSCHGFLLSRFISPFFNERTDGYGGNNKNRSKILVEISNRIKEYTEKNYPLTIKLQTQDFIQGGLNLDDSKEIVEILCSKSKYDAIEPSGGGNYLKQGEKSYPSVIINSESEQNYFLPTAKVLKPMMKNIPLILVGGIRNPIVADAIIREKHADFISLGRPLIREPNLPNRWANGDYSPSKCTSCNECYLTIVPPGNFHCPVKRRLEFRG